MTIWAVDARGVTKTFGSGVAQTPVLRGVTLNVALGEFMMLAGPSGSGKTTLLSILGCVLTPSSGEVELFGDSVTRLDERELARFRLGRIGFIFQGYNLLDALTARDNVGLPLQLKGHGVRDSLRLADSMLERVGLGDKLHSHPAALSGGQRQRVAIARALAGDPPLLLADEPTAALDGENGLLITELLREVCAERNTTVIVVTHDSRIFHLAARIVRIEDGHITSEERKEHAA